MFEGVRGASFKGDISVDDIELTDGSCASSGKNVKKMLGVMKIDIIICQGCH